MSVQSQRDSSEEKQWQLFLHTWKGWQTSYETYKETLDNKARLLDAGTSPDDPQVIALQTEAAKQHIDSRKLYTLTMEKCLAAISKANVKHKNDTDAALKAAYATAYKTMICCLIGGLLLGIIIALYFTLSLNRILGALMSETRQLIDAATAGKLDARGDASRINFEFRGIVQGFNDTLDAVIGPLNVAAEYVDRIGKGDIPPKITDNYQGDFNEIKNNLNACIDGIGGLVEASAVLHRMAVSDFSTDITGQYQGIFNEVAETIGSMQQFMKDVVRVTTNVAEGNFDDLVVLKGIGRRSEQDELMPAYIGMMENVTALTVDINLLSAAAIAGEFATRADASKHQGEFRKVVEGVNGTLDTVVEKIYWYEALLDSIPWPLSVTDMNMQWTFVNKPVEDMLKIKRTEVLGKHCSNWGAGICNTPKCGVDGLRRGILQTTFEQIGMNFQVDTMYITNAKGERVGHIEVVQDITKASHITDYQKEAVRVIAGSLMQLAKGDLNLNLTLADGDQFTEDVRANFLEIAESINQVRQAVGALITDANMLSKAGVEGQLAVRADVTKHQGDYRTIIEGVNETLDAVIGPLNVAGQVLEKLSVNDYTVGMATSYQGDFGVFAHSINDLRERLLVFQNVVVHVADGDMTDLDNLKRVGKRSEQDQMVPAFILMMETLQHVIGEAAVIIDAAAQGQLSVRGEAAQFHGSYREIVEGLNHIMDTVVAPITEASAVLERLAQNDLTVRMTGNYAGDFALIKENLNNATTALEATVTSVLGIAEQVANSAQQVALAAENIGKASHEVANGAQQVAVGSQEQSMSATEAATYMIQLQRAIEEVARGVEVGAKGAEQASMAAQKAVQAIKRIAQAADAAGLEATGAGTIAQQGADIVRKAVAGMGRVKEALASSSVKINALGDSSKKIGEIVEAINDIAEQTNLLALNAAIEAARAGEHGKGFAVVADEVRKLAERSGKQTKEIATLIRGIKDGIKDAVDSMVVATKEVADGVALAEQAGVSLESILSATGKVATQVMGVTDICKQVEGNAEEVLHAAENVSSSTEEANAATEEMAASSTEVTKAVEHVAAIIEQSSAIAEELTAASEEQNASAQEMSQATADLANLAEQTRELLGQFIVDDEDANQKKQVNTSSAAGRYTPARNERGNGKMTTRR